jgi:hypothetical protein
MVMLSDAFVSSSNRHREQAHSYLEMRSNVGVSLLAMGPAAVIDFSVLGQHLS